MIMKRIVFIPCGILPIPAVRGGAVENLVQQLLDQNELYGEYEFITYSPYDENAVKKSHTYKYTSFVFVPLTGILCKVQTAFYRLCGEIKSKVGNYDFQNLFLHKIIKDLERRGHIDCVLLENAPKFAIEIRSHFPDVKIIQHYHNVPDEQRIWQAVDNCTDKYFCISHFVKRKVEEIFHLGCASDKAKVFYNCLDISRFYKADEAKRNIIRERLGLETDDCVIIYTGRLQPYKGVKQLMQGFSNLKGHNVRLLVVGGSFYEGAKKNKFIQELESMALGLGSKVVFTGFVSYDTIPDYYAIADIAVVPSVCEDAFALTGLEAMASTLPLIVTRVGGIPEVVNNECAILLNNDNLLSKNITTALSCLVANKQKRKAMSIAALKRASTFSIDTYWKNFKSLIAEL